MTVSEYLARPTRISWFSSGPRFRQSDRSNLRIGENRMGDVFEIHPDLFPVGGIVPGQFSFFVSGMGKHRPSESIPQGPDVFLVGLKGVIHFDKMVRVGLYPGIFNF